jgi:hypothetical protein
MKAQHGYAAFAAVLAAVLAMGPAAAAPSAGPAGKGGAARLEDMPGGVKRITLTEKAVQRLGIETGKVREELIVRRQVVGGLVVSPSQVRQPQAQPVDGGFGGFRRPTPDPMLQQVASAKGPAANETWVLLSLSPAEWERLAKDQPARLRPLATRERAGKEILAKPSGMAPIEDSKRSMLHVYYVVQGGNPGLEQNQRMRVELQLDGSGQKRTVVPYSAIYYDAKGAPWVYVNPSPLVYQRQRVGVERIHGELAVLSEGPAVGTTVVTVGAPLLYGTEIFKR